MLVGRCRRLLNDEVSFDRESRLPMRTEPVDPTKSSHRGPGLQVLVAPANRLR